MENLIKMDDLGGTIICGNTHIYIYRISMFSFSQDVDIYIYIILLAPVVKTGAKFQKHNNHTQTATK